MAASTAAMVVIGNEILSGKITDANTPLVIGELRKLGVRLSRVVVIEDDVDVIASEVRLASERYDWVFTSGGLGPTHDDVTMEAIAKAFECPLFEHPELLAQLEAIRHGRPRDSLRRLTLVPEKAQLHWGEPRAPWPTVYVDNVYIFPGVPMFFRARFGDLRDMLRTEPFYSAAVYCSPSEAELVAEITEVAETHPAVEVGSYPQFGEVDHKVRVTFDSRDGAALDGALAHFLQLVPAASIVRTTRG